MSKNKKFLFISILLFNLIFSSKLFSLGIGAQIHAIPAINFTQTSTTNFGAACSIKLDRLPLIFSISTDLNLFNKEVILGLTSDYWLFNPYTTNSFKFFIGTGINIETIICSDNFGLEVSPRAILGVNYLLFDGFFELFLQQGIEFGIKNMFLSNSKTEYKINLPIELGFRVWQ